LEARAELLSAARATIHRPAAIAPATGSTAIGIGAYSLRGHTLLVTAARLCVW